MWMREYQIIKQYTDKIETIQAFFDLPGGSSVSITYNVPKGFVFVPDYSVSGSMIYYWGRVTGYADGTVIWSNIASSEVLEHLMAAGDIRNMHNKFELVLSNTDTVSHTVDFMITGFLMPEAQWDEFIEEITGRKELKVLEDIRDWLMKTLKK